MDIETREIAIRDLRPNCGEVEGLPRNPRKISKKNLEKLKKSVQDAHEMLRLRELIVFPHDGGYVLIAGNQRLEAAKAVGMTSLPCKVLPEDTDPAKLREYAIKDNLPFGEDDWEVIASDWDTAELEDWGMSVPEKWKNEAKAKEDGFDPDSVKETVCKKGDIWQLGEHRLMCGDSTDAGNVALLMDGQRADIAFTSPPYNAATTPTEIKMGKKTKYNGNSDNKSENEYTDFLSAYLQNSINSSAYSFMNVQSLSNNKKSLIDIMYRFRDVYADTIIWDKQRSQPAMANNVLNSEFEYVHIFGGNSTRAIGTIPFRGTLSNMLHISAQSKNEFADTHNATFSVEFASFFITNFAKSSVLDLFGGTGTTLIAAEQLGRKCYMMELDPHYCDVIIARWEKLTGKKATRIS